MKRIAEKSIGFVNIGVCGDIWSADLKQTNEHKRQVKRAIKLIGV